MIFSYVIGTFIHSDDFPSYENFCYIYLLLKSFWEDVEPRPCDIVCNYTINYTVCNYKVNVRLINALTLAEMQKDIKSIRLKILLFPCKMKTFYGYVQDSSVQLQQISSLKLGNYERYLYIENILKKKKRYDCKFVCLVLKLC